MNMAAKGARGEREIIEKLEADGWECYKSAASKGSFDVIALRAWPYEGSLRTQVKLIQVKRFGGRRGYGVKSLLESLTGWTGLAWVEAWLAERQDGEKEWTWTEAKRPE